MNEAPIEFEVKFFPIDLDDMRRKLILANATLKTPERLMRRCMFAQSKNPRMKCTYIRVRDEGDRATMSAKQHATSESVDSQREYETQVTDFQSTCNILLNAGLVQTGYQENKRETWQMPDGTLVELETWPKLPNYLEIEGKSVGALQKTALALNLNWDDHIVKENDYLYGIHYKISRDAVYEKIAHLTFED